MELTPEEKRKIYQEEKARIEAQEKVKSEIQAKKNKNKAIGCVVLIILAIVLLYAIFSNTSDDSSSSSSSPSPVELNATVTFTGTQFMITNGDAFAYPNATLTVNKKYKLKNVTLDAGEIYTVGMMQFADKDGNRFTSLMKPQSFSIYCSTGSWYGEWN